MPLYYRLSFSSFFASIPLQMSRIWIRPSTFHIVPMGTRPEHSKTGRVHSGTVTAVTGGYAGINLGVVLAEPIWDLRYSCAFSSPKVLFTLQIPLMLTIILFGFNGDLVKITAPSHLMPSISWFLFPHQSTSPTVSGVRSWNHIQGSDRIVHPSWFLTSVESESVSQDVRSRGQRIFLYQNSSGHADSRGLLYFTYNSNTAAWQENTDSFLHLLAALFKGGTLLAKVGHLERCREHITNHLPVYFLLLPNLLAKEENWAFP